MKIKHRKRWVQKVRIKWHPPQGFFKGSSSSIVRGLLANSKDKNQAMKRLTFYMNRAGKGLPKDELINLLAAKMRLSQ
jgi:hypothetical protein